jgi:hypothetical protein
VVVPEQADMKKAPRQRSSSYEPKCLATPGSGTESLPAHRRDVALKPVQGTLQIFRRRQALQQLARQDRPCYLLSTWAEISLAMTQISAGDVSQPGPYGVDAVVVQLVDDGKGHGSQWPYQWFTAYRAEPMLIRYRLTGTQPVD